MLKLQELEKLRDGLSALAAAGAALDACGVVPAFDLTPGQPARIVTDVMMPGGVDAAQPAAAVSPPRIVVTGDVGPVPCEAGLLPPKPTPSPAAPPEAEVEPVETAEKSPEPARPDGTLRGPLSDAERAEIDRLAAEGVTTPRIAARLNRRVQAVGLYLHSRQKQAAAPKAKFTPAAKPTPVPHTPGPRQAVAEYPKVIAPRADPVAAASETGTPIWLRELRAHLDRLSDQPPWSRAADLTLVEGLARGNLIEKVAASLCCTRSATLDRCRALTGPMMVDGRLPIECQTRLLRELRERADAARRVSA